MYGNASKNVSFSARVSATAIRNMLLAGGWKILILEDCYISARQLFYKPVFERYEFQVMINWSSVDRFNTSIGIKVLSVSGKDGNEECQRIAQEIATGLENLYEIRHNQNVRVTQEMHSQKIMAQLG